MAGRILRVLCCGLVILNLTACGARSSQSIMDEGMKEIDGVKTFMARFWIGYNYIDGKAKCLVPVTQILPEEEWTMIAKGLIAHSLKEFSNLNTILPSLYEEQKGTW